MANEIVKANTGIIHSVDDLGRIGKMMAESGFFQDSKGAAQAGVKILAGQEMGFGAFASMTGIYIIQGRPSVGANLMASAVKGNPKYDYRIREISEEKCSIEFFEVNDGKKDSIGVSTFTISEARKAGVKNLEKYARNMLFARAMSNGIRWFCPDVFNGNTTYTPEELGADVDGEGNVLKFEAEPTASTPVIETPEPVLEAEIVEPINNTPVEEKPAEAQEKPKFDEAEYLKKWKHVPALKPFTLAEASEYKTSKGKLFGTCTVEQLAYMWSAYSKRFCNAELEQSVRDDAERKMSAINEILTAKKSAMEELERKQK